MNDDPEGRWFSGSPDNISPYRKGERFIKAALLINISLSIIKIFAGVKGKSHAVLSDGIHSTVDTFSTFVVLMALKIAQRPKDDNCHFGYGKIESITAAFIGVILIFVGTWLTFKSGVHLYNRDYYQPTYIALFAAALSIVSKETLYRKGMKLGKELNSDAIIANSMDFKSDAISSVGALLGAGGSMIGNRFGIEMLKSLDPVAGIIVGLIIIRLAFEVFKKAYVGLMDYAPPEGVVKAARGILSARTEIHKIVFVKARHVGSKINMSICIRIKQGVSLQEAFQMEDEVESKIRNSIENIDEIIIDLEPSDQLLNKQPSV